MEDCRDLDPAPPGRRPAAATTVPPEAELGRSGAPGDPARRDTEKPADMGCDCSSPRTRSCAGTATLSAAAGPPCPSAARPAGPSPAPEPAPGIRTVFWQPPAGPRQAAEQVTRRNGLGRARTCNRRSVRPRQAAVRLRSRSRSACSARRPRLARPFLGRYMRWAWTGGGARAALIAGMCLSGVGFGISQDVTFAVVRLVRA